MESVIKQLRQKFSEVYNLKPVLASLRQFIKK